MDFKVIWSPEALEDLESIAAYIARDSAAYASAVVDKIVAVARRAAEFPHAGRVVPEVGEDGLRERFVYSYRLIYRIQAKTTLIVAVVHGKRLLGSRGERF